jgi:ABC-type transport system involved in multi-copper enzyme maturation permease subunit
MNLCQYKHIFGEPNTGIRIYRLFGISIFDVVVVLFAGIIISYLFKMNIWIVLFILFIFGIVVHRLFCVRTAVDKLLFTD